MNNHQFLQWLSNAPHSLITNGHRPLVMGILNVTPDSFSDGGCYRSREAAYDKAMQMVTEGADLIDIGGESTRPGAPEVSLQQEMDRVLGVIEQIRKTSDVCVSIDTSKPQVMHSAIEMGADMINDVRALSVQGAMKAAAELAVPVVLMHMQGKPDTMQENPRYQEGVVESVQEFFKRRMLQCEQAGIDKKNLILDIGFGFGKTVIHNLQLIKNLQQFKYLGRPLMLGVSRKSTLGAVLNEPVDNRLHAGIGLAVQAALNGVSMVRTHDVAPTLQALRMVQAVYKTNE